MLSPPPNTDYFHPQAPYTGHVRPPMPSPGTVYAMRPIARANRLCEAILMLSIVVMILMGVVWWDKDEKAMASCVWGCLSHENMTLTGDGWNCTYAGGRKPQ